MHNQSPLKERDGQIVASHLDVEWHCYLAFFMPHRLCLRPRYHGSQFLRQNFQGLIVPILKTPYEKSRSIDVR